MKIKKEINTWKDKNGINHFAIDYYSNAKTRWEACKSLFGRNASKDEISQWLDTEHLEVIDGGTNGKWYVCWID